MQLRHVPAGAERHGEVAGKGTHICTLLAGNLELRGLALMIEERKALDHHLPGLERDRFAGTGEVVGPLALDLDRREGRRDL
jgi:hypothetical protein